MDLSPLRAELVTDIRNALNPTDVPEQTGSIRVVDDPKQAHAPCVLVGPIVSVEVGGTAAWDVQVPVWLVAPSPGDSKAVDFLATFVTTVLDACGEATATLGTYDVGQGALPAYEIQVSLVGKEA